MEYDPKDLDIVNLLRKLKEAGGGYPGEMLALRRQTYVKQVAEVSAGAALALGVKETLKGGKAGGSSAAAAGKVVELVLVAAIVAEAGAVTYFHRDKIADFFRSFSNEPKVEEVSNPPVPPSLIPETGLVPTLAETPTFTVTDTPVSTPSVELAAQPTEQNQQGQETSSTGVETEDEGTAVGGSGTAGGGGPGSTSSSTPVPDDNNNNGNNGNHYGQTPKPERTKEPGSENSNNNQNNQDLRDRDNRNKE